MGFEKSKQQWNQPSYGALYGNQQNQMGGLGLQPLSPIKPSFGMGGDKMLGGNINQMSNVHQAITNYKPPVPKGASFNPYAMGAQVLGGIGGGHRANIGDDVWETGGALSGTAVGNASNTLGDAASQFGPVGAIAGVGLKGAADIANLIGYDPEVKDIDISDQLMQEGGPVLQIGDEISAASGIKKEGDKMVGQGALAGLKTGGAIGTAFGPLGTLIGGVIGAGGGAFLGSRKKNKAYDAYAEAMGEIDESVGEFNQANIAASNQRFGQAKRLDMMSRERNPYLVNTNSPFTV